MGSDGSTCSEVPEGTAAPQPRVDVLEIALAVATITCLLPGTWVADSIAHLFWWIINNLGVSQQMGGWVFHVVGWLLSACLLVVYCRVRGFIRGLSPSIARLADAVCLFIGICMLDIAISTANPYKSEAASWPFFVFAPFFICLLYLTPRQSLRLIRILAICTGVQASYALFYYLTSQHQFYTPHFGNRTSGTFGSPLGLYPLCLIGAPLCGALYKAQTVRTYRLLFGTAAAANLLALLFTYTRAGWLGLAIAAIVALFLPGSLWGPSKSNVRMVAAIVTVGVLAALLVRTGGHVAANPSDRSSRGRFQIWRVSLHAIAHHPWLGSGLSTYQQQQAELMTPALEQYNPMNSEAKSIYLNICVEMGLAGLGALLLIGYRYAQLYSSSSVTAPDVGIESAAVLFSTTVSAVAIAIAGFADTPILQYGRVPATFALMILFGGCAAIVRDNVKPEVAPMELPPLRTRQAARVLFVAVSLLCLWTALSSLALVRQAEPIMNHYVEEVTHSPLYARDCQITNSLIDALVAVEDRNFYDHYGVDWEAERRSLSDDIRSLSFAHGGSTITMQAVRYIMLPYDKTPARKIAQIVLALQLERRLSKQQILRLYVDSVSFGLHTAGLESAAKTYFNKRPEKLTLAECAFLVGAISHPPATIAEVTPEFARARIDPVLDHMKPLYEGKYRAEEFERARKEELHFAWETKSQVNGLELLK